jgi:hypothetical protein
MCENLYVLERAAADWRREARERAAIRQLLSEASRASGWREQPARDTRSAGPGAGQRIRRWLQPLARIAIVEPRGAGHPRGAGGSLGAAASRSR